MNRYGLKFDHFGLAVADPARAATFLNGLGYSLSETVADDIQNVNLIYCRHSDMPSVEVIYPRATPGPLDAMLRANKELVYHLCFTTSDLVAAVNRIAADTRIIEISGAKPAILFENRRVGFYRVAGFGIIELLEEKISRS
jgi:hypothetical protein